MKKFISLILTIISMVVFSVSAFADEPMVTRGQAEHCVGTDGRVGQILRGGNTKNRMSAWPCWIC